MKRTITNCDGCKDESKKCKKFFSEKYQQYVDLCDSCQELLIEYILKKAAILRFCEICQGQGKIAGQRRIDTPCCGENRPEYEQIKCVECSFWKKSI